MDLPPAHTVYSSQYDTAHAAWAVCPNASKRGSRSVSNHFVPGRAFYIFCSLDEVVVLLEVFKIPPMFFPLHLIQQVWPHPTSETSSRLSRVYLRMSQQVTPQYRYYPPLNVNGFIRLLKSNGTSSKSARQTRRTAFLSNKTSLQNNDMVQQRWLEQHFIVIPSPMSWIGRARKASQDGRQSILWWQQQGLQKICSGMALVHFAIPKAAER